MFSHVVIAILMIVVSGIGVTESWAAGVEAHGYPRIMGMNTSRPSSYHTSNYQNALSKPDIVILGFFEGWSKPDMSVRDVVKRLKEKNSKLLVGQYTLLNEWKDKKDSINARPELSEKLDAENWWLRDKNGKRMRWTDKYRAWDINITDWAMKDRDGMGYPEWLAQKDYMTFFEPVPEFDIWFFDNALSRPAVEDADWDRDGTDDSNEDTRIAAAYRNGHVAHWKAVRNLHPTVLFMGNAEDVSSQEFSGRLQGVFMEAVIGKSWSTERWKGWEGVMKRYRAAIKHTAAPHIIGFNVWGRIDDYQKMRYGLTSCLLDDGYFSYTDEDVGYGSVPWFDEYDVDLGVPVDSPSSLPWQNGVYRRTYEKGVVLVNPGLFSRTVTLEGGYRRIQGTQAPEFNNDTDVVSITLQGKDGIILTKVSRSRPLPPKSLQIK